MREKEQKQKKIYKKINKKKCWKKERKKHGQNKDDNQIDLYTSLQDSFLGKTGRDE